MKKQKNPKTDKERIEITTGGVENEIGGHGDNHGKKIVIGGGGGNERAGELGGEVIDEIEGSDGA